MIHICPIEISALILSFPLFKFILQPCCAKMLEKLKKHHKGHKKKDTSPFEYIGEHVIRVKTTDAERPKFVSTPPPPPGGWK